MTRATQATIDLSALRHNFRRVQDFAPGAKVMPVIKANAYGHGLIQVANTLAPLADAFAVATLDEGVVLRNAGIGLPVTVLQGVSNKEEMRLAQELGLDLVVHQPEQIILLEQAVNGKRLDIWLKADTGMNRLGVAPENFFSAYRRLKVCEAVAEVRAMSHFACADDPANPMTERQYQLFRQITAELTLTRSLANSAAIMAWPHTHHEWVRPGIMLYGASPMLNWPARENGLKPVMTVRSSIIAVKEIAVGESVGYGADWVAERPTRIALAAIGYGDGYPRVLPSGTPVLVNDQTAQLVGRVSMDSIALDVTELPAVQLGDPVTLWGRGLPVEEIAQRANTLSYELLCQVAPRLPRSYMEN